MEQQLTRPRGPGGPGGDGLEGENLDTLRVNLDSILAETDRILDNLRPVNAEQYLEQNRQRGGE